MVVLLFKHYFINLYGDPIDTILSILEILLFILQIFNLNKFLYYYSRVDSRRSEANQFNEYFRLIFLILFNLSFANSSSAIDSEL